MKEKTKAKKSKRKLKMPKKLIIRTPDVQSARNETPDVEIEVPSAVRPRCIAYARRLLLLSP